MLTARDLVYSVQERTHRTCCDVFDHSVVADKPDLLWRIWSQRCNGHTGLAVTYSITALWRTHRTCCDVFDHSVVTDTTDLLWRIQSQRCDRHVGLAVTYSITAVWRTNRTCCDVFDHIGVDGNSFLTFTQWRRNLLWIRQKNLLVNSLLSVFCILMFCSHWESFPVRNRSRFARGKPVATDWCYPVYKKL